MKAAIHRWLTSDPVIGQRVVSGLAGAVHGFGNRNPGWYGAQEIRAITGSWRHIPVPALRRLIAALSRQLDYYGDQIFVNQVWTPIAGEAGTRLKSLIEPDDPTLRAGDAYLELCRPKAEPSAVPPSFSVVTPYYRHFNYFRECALSVAKAIRQAGRLPVEWVIVNDDPSVCCDRLRSVVPASIRDRTRLLVNETNIGNTASLNVGIVESRFDWIVFLDCDDLLSPSALRILSRYIAGYRRCRYFSSSMVDIDHAGRVLRYRIRDTKATQLFTEGMTAGHLKAIRRDAFRELGLLDVRFDGSQDREFALRMAMKEPICFIPEFLYRYRSHSRTQTLSGLERQFARSRNIRRLYLDRIAEAAPAEK